MKVKDAIDASLFLCAVYINLYVVELITLIIKYPLLPRHVETTILHES